MFADCHQMSWTVSNCFIVSTCFIHIVHNTSTLIYCCATSRGGALGAHDWSGFNTCLLSEGWDIRRICFCSYGDTIITLVLFNREAVMCDRKVDEFCEVVWMKAHDYQLVSQQSSLSFFLQVFTLIFSMHNLTLNFLHKQYTKQYKLKEIPIILFQ